jgi:hypothetical protein
MSETPRLKLKTYARAVADAEQEIHSREFVISC